MLSHVQFHTAVAKVSACRKGISSGEKYSNIDLLSMGPKKKEKQKMQKKKNKKKGQHPTIGRASN